MLFFLALNLFLKKKKIQKKEFQKKKNVNDPSAGSPTETLLRLLLPLNDQVWSSFYQQR